MVKQARYVEVDMGYGCAEHWERAKVCDSRVCGNLFDTGTSEDLLVEVPGGERVWVSSWRDLQ